MFDLLCCIYLVFPYQYLFSVSVLNVREQALVYHFAAVTEELLKPLSVVCFVFQPVRSPLGLVSSSALRTFSPPAARPTFASAEASLSVHFHFLSNQKKKSVQYE